MNTDMAPEADENSQPHIPSESVIETQIVTNGTKPREKILYEKMKDGTMRRRTMFSPPGTVDHHLMGTEELSNNDVKKLRVNWAKQTVGHPSLLDRAVGAFKNLLARSNAPKVK